MFQIFSDTIVRVISVYGYGGLLTDHLKVKAFTDIEPFRVFKHEKDYHKKLVSL